MRRPQEQTYSGLCHLLNAVPVWGLIFCGWIWFSLREESRLVIFHARQAMLFHSGLLLALLIWLLCGLFAKVITVIAPGVGSALAQINDWVMGLLYLAYLAICLMGCVRTMSGQKFHYPILRIAR